MTTHQRQLRGAWKLSGLTLVELRKSARLKVSVVSLSRKLSGQQAMTNKEIAALATALGVQVAVTEQVVTLGARS